MDDMDCSFVNIYLYDITNEQNYCPLFSFLQPTPKIGIVNCVQSVYLHYNNQMLCMLSFYRMTLYTEPVNIESNTLHTNEYVNDIIRL